MAARVVPAMQTLLLGTQAAAVSQKAAKKGRESLLRLVMMERERSAAAAATMEATMGAATVVAPSVARLAATTLEPSVEALAADYPSATPLPAESFYVETSFADSETFTVTRSRLASSVWAFVDVLASRGSQGAVASLSLVVRPWKASTPSCKASAQLARLRASAAELQGELSFPRHPSTTLARHLPDTSATLPRHSLGTPTTLARCFHDSSTTLPRYTPTIHFHDT